MELEGSLKAFSLPEVLQFLSMGKMSGYLHLSRGSQSIALTIKLGRIVNSSTLSRNLRLGEMLIQRGLLKRRDLEEILSLQKTIENDKRLGELLLERDLVKNEDLRETIRLQLEEEVWDLFSWEDGQFKFENLPEQEISHVAVHIDIEPLLLEGSRRQDEWSKIRRSIPDDSVVFRVLPLPKDFQRTLKLSLAEWKVLSTLNGHLSVAAVVHRCALGRFETCHILNSFLASELIEVRPKTPPPDEPLEPKILAPEAQQRAEQLMQSVPQEAGPRRLGGFFGKSPKPAERPETTSQPLSFLSPASLMAAIITGFMQQAVQQKDFAAKPEEDHLLETLWSDLLMEHPRADLLRCVGNVADPTILESYVETTEFFPVVQECHEEIVEALGKMLRMVYRISAQRLGERSAQKILQSLIEGATARVTLRYGNPFDLAARCSRILGQAA